MSDAAAERLREAVETLSLRGYRGSGPSAKVLVSRDDIIAILSEREADKRRIAELERVAGLVKGAMGRDPDHPDNLSHARYCRKRAQAEGQLGFSPMPCVCYLREIIAALALVEEETTDG